MLHTSVRSPQVLEGWKRIVFSCCSLDVFDDVSRIAVVLGAGVKFSKT